MPGRYFSNRLSDWSGGTVVVDEQLTAQSFGDVLRDVLGRGPAGLKPSVYTGKQGQAATCSAGPCHSASKTPTTHKSHQWAAALPPHAAAGAAGIAYALWHAHRQTSRLTAVAFSEEELLDRAEQYARVALGGTARQAPGEHYGWSLLAGQAGVYATAALVFDAGADLAERQGRQARAAGLRQERQQWVQQYCALHRLACSSACQEDEVGSAPGPRWLLPKVLPQHALHLQASNKVPPIRPPYHHHHRHCPPVLPPWQVLYGRSGYLLGCLLLNNQLQPGSVPQEAMQSVVEAIIASGELCCLLQLLPHLPQPAGCLSLLHHMHCSIGAQGAVCRPEPGCASPQPGNLSHPALLPVAPWPRRLPLPGCRAGPDG